VCKVATEPLSLIFGVLLFVTPFFITDVLWLVVAGLVLVAIPMMLKKFLSW
jgi:VIT1/CCC1 family predicted Fe2+/Mn2+ transporter